MSKKKENIVEVVEVEQLKKKALKLTMKELLQRIEALEDEVASLKNKRGPKSTREMTEEDAIRVLTGDLADKSHKECAAELGLSYGQIYSCRGGYTFKSLDRKKNNVVNG